MEIQVKYIDNHSFTLYASKWLESLVSSAIINLVERKIIDSPSIKLDDEVWRAYHNYNLQGGGIKIQVKYYNISKQMYYIIDEQVAYDLVLSAYIRTSQDLAGKMVRFTSLVHNEILKYEGL